MKITEIESLASKYYSQEARDRVRSPGLHLSDILEDIEQALNPRDYDSEGRDWDPYRKMGFVWERVLGKAMAGCGINLIAPGEIEKDGIIMSPDRLDPDPWALEEWKATWKSYNRVKQHGIEGAFPRWIWQKKSYCYALGCDTSRLRAFFVNGDYRGSGPLDPAWEFEFTDRELKENWDMITNHAKSRGWL